MRKSILLVGAAAVVVSGGLAVAFAISWRAPDDEKLLASFRSHRESFEQLRKLVTEDAKYDGYFSSSHLDSRIDEGRRAQYKELLDSVSDHLSVIVNQDGSIKFNVSEGGILSVGPGWSKGMEYIPGDVRKSGTLVSSLNRASSMGEGIYLKRIDDRWFLFYERAE